MRCPPFTGTWWYGLTTAIGRRKDRLRQTGGYNGKPSIHGQRVTWQQFQEHNESAIVLLDFDAGQQTIIGDGGRGRSLQLISEDYVVWAVAEPCDVLGIRSRQGSERLVRL